MTYQHGITATEIVGGTRNLRTVATAIIGLVATADDADATVFPLNTAVPVTDLAAAIGKAGETGTLAKSLRAISDQARATLVVVRVAEGDDAAETTANVIGTTDANGLKTGMQALLAAEAQLGLKPRIIGAPGLDTQAVTAALIVVAKKLRAMAYAAAIGATVTAATTYRDQFSARELMLIWPDVKAYDLDDAAIATVPAVAYALGLRALIDQEQGWHKTLSNVALQGVLGLSRDVQFDLQDPNTEANLLNASEVTTVINYEGYRFWGSRTCSDEPLFAFESAARTAQIILDTVAGGLMWAIDKPLIPSLAKDIVETINGKFREMKSAGQIIGAKAWFDPAKNTPDLLAAGKLTIDYDYTPVPPLENLLLRQTITDSYFADFAAGVTG
jgi:phage tail sheath protein FI